MPEDRPQLILLGGGGHALVVADAALHTADLAGCYDDAPEPCVCRLMPCPRLGALGQAAGAPSGALCIIALGDLRARRALTGIIASTRWARVIHPTAHIARLATIGPGVFVGPRAVVHTAARVGAHAIINTGATIEHECEIGENTHIAPGAAMGGRVRIGRDCLIGLGARILPNITIGDGCTIGAGSVVTRDLPSGAAVKGVPAR